jgi:hypothetical protein
MPWVKEAVSDKRGAISQLWRRQHADAVRNTFASIIIILPACVVYGRSF